MYNPFPYYNSQTNIDNINNNIAELEKLKSQLQARQQPTNLTQNFQLAPNSQNGMKYANSIDDVKKEQVFSDTPFFTKDMGIVWVKSPSNSIKTYELKEIIEKDEKDLKIDFLMSKIDVLEKELKNATIYTNTDEPIEDKKPTSIQSGRTIKKK